MAVGLVLGGGGVLGAVEVGMVRALFRAHIKPDILLGTSIGAINAAMVAVDPTPAVIDDLVRLWATPEMGEAFGDSVSRQMRRFATRHHLHNPDPLRRMLKVPLHLMAASIAPHPCCARFPLARQTFTCCRWAASTSR